MSILFHCEHCRKEVKAPDDAGGHRGKCPYCSQSNYIPLPAEEREEIPLKEVDEQEERRAAEEAHRLMEAEQELLREMGGPPAAPLEQRDNLSVTDLYHFIVNYCLDMANGQLERAQTHVGSLKKFGPLGLQAVEDSLSGRVQEAALDSLPTRVVQGYLKQLRADLK